MVFDPAAAGTLGIDIQVDGLVVDLEYDVDICGYSSVTDTGDMTADTTDIVSSVSLAVEEGVSHKRLFVADTWSDRVLGFDMTPGQVSSGMEASYVLGQGDFTTRDTTVAANRFYFASREGAGIYPSQSAQDVRGA